MKYSKENLINLEYQNTKISILAERGAIITSLIIENEEILYQDMIEETLWDTEKSIRAGIPFMFPQAGLLLEEEAKKLGYNMPQHGIARKNIWKILEKTQNSISFVFDNKMQEGEFKIPYDFEIVAKYILEEKGLNIEYNFKNKSEQKIAISPGIHPYFRVIGSKDDITWDSKYQNQIKEEKNIWQNDGTSFLEKVEKNFDFYLPGIGEMQITFDDATKNIWIWSLPNKNFVCVEPVSGNPGNIAKNPIWVEGLSNFNFKYGIFKK